MNSSRKNRVFVLLAGCALAATFAVGGSVPASAAGGTDPRQVRFDVADVNGSTGLTTWTVPVNICSIQVEAAGANGGDSWSSNIGRATAGHGAIITANESVTPGQVLTVAVGSAPTANTDGAVSGGAPGGGPSTLDHLGGWGGGWSGLATGATPSQSNVLVVAGAGGGAGNATDSNGGDAGTAGATVTEDGDTAGGGGPGTDSAGGAGGTGALDGGDGSALQGGGGSNGGGGGGAGYFGGGGGAVYLTAGGGGGGSSYPLASSPDRVSYTVKSSSDQADGWVILRYDPTDPADTCVTPSVTATGANGAALDGQTVNGGSSFNLSGSDWPAGQTLTVSFESSPVVIGTATVAGDGTFSFDGKIPVAAASGAHHIVLTPTADTLPTFNWAITVAALATTGLAVEPWMIGGPAAGILAGILLLFLTRSRRLRRS